MPALVLPALSAVGMLSVMLLAGCEADNAPTTPEAKQALQTSQDSITKTEQAAVKGKGATPGVQAKIIRKPGAAGAGN
jgi:hypothetical protein